MLKVAFTGAGSAIFAKNVLGDCMMAPPLRDAHIALYDIDATRLDESKLMLDTINKNVNAGRARITAYCGVESRKAALSGAGYVFNAIQVGGYQPSTVIDFEVPKRYGLRQTIADTTGIGGIFRALRTIPVMLDFARDMADVCPDALMLNYTNPMPTISTAMARANIVPYVGLCHSVQGCAPGLLRNVGLADSYPAEQLRWRVAGINHMGWLLAVSCEGKDLYPEIKRKAAGLLHQIGRRGGARRVIDEAVAEKGDNFRQDKLAVAARDMARLKMMLTFGYYNTESSEHAAEYHPYFIKSTHPELIDEFGIPLDCYMQRCIDQIKRWKKTAEELVHNPQLEHKRSHEYASRIVEAIETGTPFRFGGNIMNTGLITNLPRNMAVEVPCVADRNGVQGIYVGELPEVCAALNRTNVNVHLLAADAALNGRKESIYHAALLDPHVRSELTIDETVRMCDEMIEAHGDMLPAYR